MKLVSPSTLLVTLFLGAAASLTSGCSAKNSDLHSTKEREMTVGVVQKEIKPGMAQADVAVALGSPNIVTKNSNGNETWIYDKIASEASYSRGSGGASLIIFGFGKETSKSATTQKTLTVVINFDKNSNVDKVSYHTSKF